MKILITGFDPFGGENVNPAWEAVQRVKAPQGCELRKLMVPTVFGRAEETVLSEMRRYQPDVVLMVGQAGGRSDITPERVAVNVDDARIPDNEGNQPVDTAICDDGPAAYFSRLPIRAMAEAARAEGIPASISNTAGTFVCNHLMYAVLHEVAKGESAGVKIRAGFVHVPFIPEQTEGSPEVPSMPLDRIVRGLEVCLEAAAR